MVVVRDQKGRSPSRSIRLAVYARDRYICRYRHCQRATVDERVVAALALLMPQALPYHRNWPADRAHPLVWTHLASLEHVKPWSTGGDNSLDKPGYDMFAMQLHKEQCLGRSTELASERGDPRRHRLGWTHVPASAVAAHGERALTRALRA